MGHISPGCHSKEQGFLCRELEGSLIPTSSGAPLPCLIISRRHLADKGMYTHLLFIPPLDRFLCWWREAIGHHRLRFCVDLPFRPIPLPKIRHFHTLLVGAQWHHPPTKGNWVIANKTLDLVRFPLTQQFHLQESPLKVALPTGELQQHYL